MALETHRAPDGPRHILEHENVRFEGVTPLAAAEALGGVPLYLPQGSGYVVKKTSAHAFEISGVNGVESVDVDANAGEKILVSTSRRAYGTEYVFENRNGRGRVTVTVAEAPAAPPLHDARQSSHSPAYYPERGRAAEERESTESGSGRSGSE